MKKIFYLSGFPRSGNTLLSSILSQNPNIQCTGKSILPDVFFRLNTIKNIPAYKNFEDNESYENMMKNIRASYYEKWKKPIIIERGDWITPYNINMLNHYHPNNKIIVLVRPVLDIIKSHLKLAKKYSNYEFNDIYHQLDKSTIYTNREETICDLVMKKNGYVDLIIASIYRLIKYEKTENLLFVEYDKLVDDTGNTLDKIYDFLDIDKYQHHFTNLDQFSVEDVSYNDSLIGANIHEIRTDKVEKDKTEIELSSYIVNKYSNLDFWKTLV